MNLPNKIQDIINRKNYVRDDVGKSGAGVYLYEDMVLKIQKIDAEAENEASMLQWLSGKLPIPSIIEHICDNGYSYILMNKCAGKMACDPYFMKRPKQQVELLAEALHSLWSVDITDCPCKWPLKRRLELAEDNIIHNRVDVDDVEPDTFGPRGFRDPEALLHWLKENQPEEKEILCHGDFCLPNIFLSDSDLTGIIDLGKAGVADPWLDISLCYRSLDHNYGGVYHGRSYAGFEPQMLFEALGIRPDPERIRYYILLDELF